MKKLNILSFFNGISCGQHSLEKSGIPVNKYYASEIDKYTIQITQKNYPNTIQLGDVTKIDFTQFTEKIDLLIGGSPCQDLSITGKRKGLEGERSGLFYKYLEALKTIKPKYFLLENNYGMPKDVYQEISQLMGCYPILINSALVSAQNRLRYYWTNIGDKQYNLFGFPTVCIEQPKNKNLVIKDILENKVDEKYYLSDTRVKRFRQTTNSKNIGTVKVREDSIGQKDIIYDINNKMGCSMATDYKYGKLILVGYINTNSQGNRVYDVKGKGITLTTGGGNKSTGLYLVCDKEKYRIRRLTPIECERLQTLPDNYTKYGVDDFGNLTVISDSQRYKCLGNGWTVDVIAHIFKGLKESEE